MRAPLYDPQDDLPDIAAKTLERLRARRPRMHCEALYNLDRATIGARAKVSS